ncbi:hypothetical protein KRM28CT15_23290 [Krasilnikovia sp. M28-CT-15]
MRSGAGGLSGSLFGTDMLVQDRHGVAARYGERHIRQETPSRSSEAWQRPMMSPDSFENMYLG